MEEKIISTMEEIEKDPKKLEQMREINEIDKLYQFFAENGYSQSLEKFKEELINFIESAKVELEGDSYLENVSGGNNLKNKLTKATSLGLASLLAVGSPVSYASTSGSPGKSASTSNGWLNSSLAKKLIKIGIPVTLLGGGAGLVTLAVWKCIKHNDGKKEATEHPTTIQPIDVHSDLGQIYGDNIQQSVIEGPDSPSTYSGASVTSTTSTPTTTRSSSPVKVEESAPPASLTTPTDPQPVAVTTTSPTGNNEPVSELPLAGDHNPSSEKKENAPSEPAASDSPQEKKDDVQFPSESEEDIELNEEKLIREVLGEKIVEPFKKLADDDKEKVIELVRKIQKILGEDANNLDKYVHDEVRLNIIDLPYRAPAYWWFHYICNALDGYMHQKKQQNYFDPICFFDSLVLSFALSDGNIESSKMGEVRKCINYLYENLEEHYLNNLTPDELIQEIQELNSNKTFPEARSTIFQNGPMVCSIITFAHLLHYVLEQDLSLKGDLSGLKFKCYNREYSSFGEAIFENPSALVGSEYEFEILKDESSMGTFRFIFSWFDDDKTAKLEKKSKQNNLVDQYVYNLKTGNITFKKSTAATLLAAPPIFSGQTTDISDDKLRENWEKIQQNQNKQS